MDAPTFDVDTTIATWHDVSKFCEARIALLTETCTSLLVSDEDRRIAAARIAELRELLDAPNQARLARAQRATDDRRGVY